MIKASSRNEKPIQQSKPSLHGAINIENLQTAEHSKKEPQQKASQ